MCREYIFLFFAIAPFLASFLTGLIVGPLIIGALRRGNMNQKIAEDVPEHMVKEGTPVMGGLIIVAGTLVGGILIKMLFLSSNHCFEWRNFTAVISLVASYVLLGFIDDYLTIRPIRNIRGISSKPKALIQLIVAAIFVFYVTSQSFGTIEPVLKIGCVTILSGIWYKLFCVLFIAGMANFVNITDGLDGLVGGLSIIALGSLIFGAILCGSFVLNGPLFLFISAVCGGIMAFLWYNAYPAKIFMGDMGSLGIGALLPAVAIISHMELFVIIAGMIFIVDGLSTALQWAVFKYTRIRKGEGRRFFKKAPIHHHFQLCDIAETSIVVRFWICGIIAAILAVCSCFLTNTACL